MTTITQVRTVIPFDPTNTVPFLTVTSEPKNVSTILKTLSNSFPIPAAFQHLKRVRRRTTTTTTTSKSNVFLEILVQLVEANEIQINYIYTFLLRCVCLCVVCLCVVCVRRVYVLYSDVSLFYFYFISNEIT